MYTVRWVPVLFLTALITVFQTAINVYGTLATGWGDSGTVLSVLLTILIAQKWMGKDIHGMNLIQTGASGGASVGFIIACMASMQVAGRSELPLSYVYAMMAATCFIGCCVAIPLRRSMVTNSTLPYPDAVITSELLRTATSDDPARVKRASIVMATAGLWSLLLTFLTKVKIGTGVLIHSIYAPKVGVYAAKKVGVATLGGELGFAWSPEPLFVGIGFVVSFRTGVSLLVGGLLSLFFFKPLGLTAGLDLKDSAELHKWFGIAMMLGISLVEPIIGLIVKKGGESATKRIEEKRSPWAVASWILLFLALVTVAVKVFGVQHKIPWHNVLVAIAVMWALTFVAVRATGAANINPVRAAAMTTIVVMMAFLPADLRKDPQVLLAIGLLAGAGATMAGDMMVDYKCGKIIGTNPLHQTYMQFFSVAIGALVAPLMFWVITHTFELGKAALPAPGAQVWAGMAELLAGGKQFSTLHWTVTGIAAIVGVIFTLLERKEGLQRFIPSAMGMGIAMLLPFEMASAIFVGAAIKKVLSRVAPVWDKEHGYNAGIGIFAGGALAGVVVAFLIAGSMLLLKYNVLEFPLWELGE
ncbi:MAG: OPT/YSL family transporter [Patescibacteria group bacterium]